MRLNRRWPVRGVRIEGVEELFLYPVVYGGA